MCHFIFLDNHTLIDLQWSSILKVFIFNTVSDLDSGHPLTDQYGPALCSVLIWNLIRFWAFRKAGWACFAMWNSLAFWYFFRLVCYFGAWFMCCVSRPWEEPGQASCRGYRYLNIWPPLDSAQMMMIMMFLWWLWWWLWCFYDDDYNDDVLAMAINISISDH